ncbi:choline/ethanolamine kinase family protein [Nocardioides bruguierae]|uniref:choline/ethanolamine kinase family protein n=1 Tax=Nocardioides bruguierae TaxID=2945102 RepID=UPI00202143B7|nr:choline/ethanolamine kinase family protein [Nocardioides bruguierae]MCL8025327.1 phosphotransferase family protein [Nocardioides bruguierae]
MSGVAADPEAVIAVLDGLPAWPWAGLDITMSPIGGGLNNSNWRMQVARGEELFLKLPGTGTDAYVDRDLAHAAARAAARAGVGPDVVYYDRISGVEVTEFLSGYRPLVADELTGTDVIHDVVALYRRLHAGPLLPGPARTTMDEARAVIDQVRTAGIRLAPWMERVITVWHEAEQSLVASGYDVAPCHNDPNFTNMMVRPGHPLQLVDYEFAANNDPTFELSSLLCFYNFSDLTRAALLEEYHGRYELRHEARLRVCYVGMLVRMGLWAIEKAHATDPDYDYLKYGSVFFLEAVEYLRDPRWTSWVSSL